MKESPEKCPNCGYGLKDFLSSLFSSLGKKGGKTVTAKKIEHLKKAAQIRWQKEKEKQSEG